MVYIVPPGMHTPPGFTRPLGFVVRSVPSSLRSSLEESLRLPDSHLLSLTHDIYTFLELPCVFRADSLLYCIAGKHKAL